MLGMDLIFNCIINYSNAGPRAGDEKLRSQAGRSKIQC